MLLKNKKLLQPNSSIKERMASAFSGGVFPAFACSAPLCYEAAGSIGAGGRGM